MTRDALLYWADLIHRYVVMNGRKDLAKAERARVIRRTHQLIERGRERRRGAA